MSTIHNIFFQPDIKYKPNGIEKMKNPSYINIKITLTCDIWQSLQCPNDV